MSEPRTISRAQARLETRRLWEQLRDITRNEEAWAVIQDALDEIQHPCHCRVGRRYRLDQGECECKEDK